MAFKMKSGNKPGFASMGSSPAKDMKTGSYNQSFESPAKQRVSKSGEGQDQDKVFDDNGKHVANWVNGKKVMKSTKGMTKNFSDLTPAEIKAMKLDEPYNTLAPKKPAGTKKKSPAKQLKGSGHGPATKFDKERYPVGNTELTDKNPFAKKKKDKYDSQINKMMKKKGWNEGKKISDYTPEELARIRDPKYQARLTKKVDAEIKANKKKSPAKQTDTTWADGTKKSARDRFNDKETAIEQRKADRKDNQKSPYWYKVNGKSVTRAKYIKYENKPGGDEPGKQTNNPDVYGKIANNHGRGPKTKK